MRFSNYISKFSPLLTKAALPRCSLRNQLDGVQSTIASWLLEILPVGTQRTKMLDLVVYNRLYITYF